MKARHIEVAAVEGLGFTLLVDGPKGRRAWWLFQRAEAANEEARILHEIHENLFDLTGGVGPAPTLKLWEVSDAPNA